LDRIEVVKRAIEYRGPQYLPFELLDVPGIYSAYSTLNPDSVRFIEGTQNFDALWLGYNWTLEELGTTDDGEPIRKDEWGVIYKVPKDENSAYVILENPIKEDRSNYHVPNPKGAMPFFERSKAVIEKRYSDRFINGYIDPGAFLVAFAMVGYDNLLVRLIDDPGMVKKLIHSIFEYHKGLVSLFKDIGAHMITVIDEIAGSGGLMFSPDLFRREFLTYYKDFFRFVHSQNLYSGILLDGNVTAIIEDIIAMDTDCVQFMEPNAVGIEVISQNFKGKRCIKASVDMRETLAVGSVSQVESEAHSLVQHFNTPKGGFIPIILRWFRPVYPEKNVAASVRAFNAYRGEKG
jgi:uroporphyrinogen-III decarboxylase